MINIYTNEIRSWNNTSRVVWPRLLTASNNLQSSSLAEKSYTSPGGGGGNSTAKQATFYRAGIVRVTFDWWGQQYCGFILLVSGETFVDDIANPDGDETDTPSEWHTVSYDVPVKMLGTITLQNHVFDTGMTAKVRNLRIYSDTIRIKNNLDI